MIETLSALVLVAIITVIVYAVDAAVSAAGRARWLRWVAFGLSLILVLSGLAVLAAGISDDGTVRPAAPGLLAAGGVLLIVLFERGRDLVARVVPIDRDSLRSWVGLVMLLWLAALRLVTAYGAGAEVGEVTLIAAAVQTLAFLGIAFGLIGMFTRRGWRQSLKRLGFTDFRWQSISVGLAGVIPMLVIGALTVYLVETVSPGTIDRLDETVTEITGGETSLGYGLALGIFAAAGEETLFRGAIQPKYGLVFTALIFAVLHVQYDVLLVLASLFPVGLILGLERKYLGTVACVVTHALYNTLAVVVG